MQSLDFFPKTQPGLTERTLSGGVISAASLLFVLWAGASELSDCWRVVTDERLVPQADTAHQMAIPSAVLSRPPPPRPTATGAPGPDGQRRASQRRASQTGPPIARAEPPPPPPCAAAAGDVRALQHAVDQPGRGLPVDAVLRGCRRTHRRDWTRAAPAHRLALQAAHVCWRRRPAPRGGSSSAARPNLAPAPPQAAQSASPRSSALRLARRSACGCDASCARNAAETASITLLPCTPLCGRGLCRSPMRARLARAARATPRGTSRARRTGTCCTIASSPSSPSPPPRAVRATTRHSLPRIPLPHAPHSSTAMPPPPPPPPPPLRSRDGLWALAVTPSRHPNATPSRPSQCLPTPPCYRSARPAVAGRRWAARLHSGPRGVSRRLARQTGSTRAEACARPRRGELAAAALLAGQTTRPQDLRSRGDACFRCSSRCPVGPNPLGTCSEPPGAFA